MKYIALLSFLRTCCNHLYFLWSLLRTCYIPLSYIIPLACCHNTMSIYVGCPHSVVQYAVAKKYISVCSAVHCAGVSGMALCPYLYKQCILKYAVMSYGLVVTIRGFFLLTLEDVHRDDTPPPASRQCQTFRVSITHLTH